MKKIFYSIVALLTGSGVILGASTVINSNRTVLDSVVTTEVTTTTLETIQLSPGTSTTHITMNVVANASTSTLGGGWFCIADFKVTNTSTVTQVGSFFCNSSASAGLGVSVSTGTQAVLLKINGLTSSTINWQSFTDVYTVK